VELGNRWHFQMPAMVVGTDHIGLLLASAPALAGPAAAGSIGLMLPGTTLAPQLRIRSCTNGSLWIISSAWRWRACCAAVLRACRCVGDGADFDNEFDSRCGIRPAQGGLQCELEFFASGGLVQGLALNAQGPDRILLGAQLRLQRQLAYQRAYGLGTDHLAHQLAPVVTQRRFDKFKRSRWQRW
jgi:hypothetical protein